ncbi:hypothetical protein [Halobacteriovorax sp. JY17]|uniref:hypothetical protein n=1 Tax=Halobacteriovorax sp. JY17 TaxID=2014617 RepID=UPI000C4915DD|nr:hypothetical protein [Halobacteriovorax sp. JY17]PIK13891.1 MAG: hypothetical protein CES88_12965 [Halobacteriovorax sp. JY17]
MKKILGLTAAVVMGLTSTAALASKARILALGEETEDHYFIEDSRSIFTNASYVNNYADTLMLEWGGNGAGNSSFLDTDSSPKAMGGFLKRSGNFVYGIYLGNESNVSTFLRVLASPDTFANGYLASSDNQTDIFVGSETTSGIKWGASFVYTNDKNEANTAANSSDKGMAMRLGAQKDMWEAFANISLASESERKNIATPTKFDGKLGFQLGGSYKFDDLKVFASYKQFDWEQTGGNQAAGVKTDGGFTRYFVGAGRTIKVNETDTVFVKAMYNSLNVELEYASGKAELTRNALPLTVGYEAQATSWLVLRGSVTHNLMGTAESKNLGTVVGTETGTNGLKYAALGAYNGSTTDGKAEIANSTNVSTGATLLFGNLSIDGFVGLTSSSRTAAAQAETGTLALDNLLTRVGMTYKF